MLSNSLKVSAIWVNWAHTRKRQNFAGARVLKLASPHNHENVAAHTQCIPEFSFIVEMGMKVLYDFEKKNSSKFCQFRAHILQGTNLPEIF